MKPYLSVVNAFLEDTCVLMVIAYLLARGRMLALLIAERITGRQALTLGVVLGLVGITEVIFPGLRSPYVLHTLIITFATLLGGLRVGAIAIVTVIVGVAILGTPLSVIATSLTLTVSALLAAVIRRLFGPRFRLMRGLTAGMCAQSGVVLLHQLPVAGFPPAHAMAHALVAIPANGFGVLLLQLLVNEAEIRANSERHRLEAERVQALMVQSQLTALRARVHPHFLFNALTSIAALCSLAPATAETSVLRLSQLMRRALEVDTSTLLCLSEEAEYVRGYLEIEQHRFGSRLHVVWEVDEAAANVQVPAFALQMLVENAISHGFAPKLTSGTIRIAARMYRQHVLIAVLDDGVGMPASERAKLTRDLASAWEAAPHKDVDDLPGRVSDTLVPVTPSTVHRLPDAKRLHGLQIINAQLTLLYGARARLRLFSREDQGTRVAFVLPKSAGLPDCPHSKEDRDADRPDRG